MEFKKNRLFFIAAASAILLTAAGCVPPAAPDPGFPGNLPIQRVSVDASGAQGDNESYSRSISADGRYVAFRSDATNLVAGDTNNMRDVFAAPVP